MAGRRDATRNDVRGGTLIPCLLKTNIKCETRQCFSFSISVFCFPGSVSFSDCKTKRSCHFGELRFSIHMYNPGLIWQFFKLDSSKSRSSLKPAATRGSGYVPSWDGKLTLLDLSPQISGDGKQPPHCDSTLPEIITKTLLLRNRQG